MNFTSSMSLIWIETNHFVNMAFISIIGFFVGNSIRACKNIGKYVLGLESDKKLFDVVLQPMMSIAPPSPPPQAYVPIAKKPKKVVAVKWRRVEDYE